MGAEIGESLGVVEVDIAVASRGALLDLLM